jgi:phage terminase large subunit-like protein
MAMTTHSTSLSGVDRYRRYLDGVLSHKIPACRWVRRCAERQARDLKRKRFAYRFDEARANEPVAFVEALPHIKGEWARDKKKLILSDWQCFITCVAFGWVDKVGRRRFRTVYIEVPRKNGKSSWSAGIALFMLAADGEEGAEIYSAATAREQAAIVWKAGKKMVEKTPALRQALGVATSSRAVYVDATASTFLALSREQQGNLDGLNVHFAAVDELHAHKDRSTWDVIETATGSRSQPMIWAITTAGFNRSGICFEQQAYVRKILTGAAKDDTYFGIIYTIDVGVKGQPDDDWTDPKTWIKANPNWGVSVDPSDIERKARKAMQMAAAQNNFLTKHLNVWVNADTAWMEMRAWERCGDGKLDIEDFVGADCIAALDLATKTDLAARILLFQRLIDDKTHYYVFGRYYLPEEAAEDGRNAHYAGWAKNGLVVLTPGNVTDFEFIEEDLKEDAARFVFSNVAYDPWQAAQLSQRMTAEGMAMLEYRQTTQNMSEPMKELEKLVLQGRLHHNGDEALTWMISNVVCHIDAKENVYPRKEMPENKIDGAIALIMALGVAMSVQTEQPIGADYRLLTI